ncbi:MAG: hypothetical protein J6W51_07055 [Fibrobacter sp.]|nr:hypothetical protein [Fibrobacter sp.]
MKFHQFIAFSALLCYSVSCTVERAEEQILARHANGIKKTSIWVYPDGTILKRNEWYNDGIKELEIPYDDSVPHGEFKRWTGFGDVAMVGHYKKGLRDGKWTSYFVDRINSRKKEAERYYKDDHPIGDWIGWHYNGEKAFEEHYDDNGNPTGVWKKWYDNGVLAEENSNCYNEKKIVFENIKPTPGFLKRYSRDCKILEDYECFMGLKQGKYKLYYESFGSPDSSAESCSKSKLREEGITDDAECGEGLNPTALYRADGSTKKKVEYHTEDCGYSPSRVSWFDEHGALLRETVFKNHNHFGYDGIAYGLCEGSTKHFCAETSFVQYANPNGNLDSSSLSQKEAFRQNIGKFKAAVRYIKPGHKLLYEEYWDFANNPEWKYSGPILLVSRSFYPDSMGGRMASEGFWGNPSVKGKSKPHGIWRNWYPSGILRDSLTYVNGERVGEQFCYDSTGKLTIHKTENGKNRPVIMHLLDERRGSAGSPTLTKDEREKIVTH